MFGSPVVDRAALIPTAIAGVVAQAVGFLVSQQPPTRNLRIAIVSRNETVAQAAAHFEMWNASSRTWVATSVDVGLNLVAGGWRVEEIGALLTTTQIIASAEETSTMAAATQTSVSIHAVTAEFTLQMDALIQTPNVGAAVPVLVTNHDAHAHTVTISVEIDVLLRDPAATGWWTVTGVMKASLAAGATQSVMVALTKAPYAFPDEEAAVLTLLQTESPADSTNARATITSVDGVASVAATPAP